MFSIGDFIIDNSLLVGNINQHFTPFFDTIAEDGQSMVHDLERRNAEVANGKGLMRMNLMKLDSGHTRITVFGKAIRQHLEHTFASDGVGIDIDFSKLTIGPDIVHTTHVVVVGMGDEDAVNTTEGMGHDLLAEIGSTVDEQSRLRRFYEGRAAQSLVARIGAGAGVTLAADGGDATRGSGSEKCQFHVIIKDNLNNDSI